MRLERFNKDAGERIGKGSAKETYIDPKSENKIISVFDAPDKNELVDETPRSLKGAFYLTKIAHLLLPEHVPDIHQAGQAANGQMTFERARIPHSKEHAALQSVRMSGGAESDKMEQVALVKSLEGKNLGEVDMQLENIGMHDIDGDLNNYLQNPAGDMQYIETFKPWSYIGTIPERMGFSEPELREAIAQCPDAETRRMCESYLARILALYEEEKAEVEKKKEP